ncbi:MAG: alginate lyase family protein [Candidatus Sumerlaeota bacterium]|nr:alginate lyase family protein [Candidatus Sumerlaeota bacterium]
MKQNLMLILAAAAWFVCFASAAKAQAPALAKTPAPAFIHPGMLHNLDDLNFMKRKVEAREQPWLAAWDKMRQEKIAKLDWTPKPVAQVVRGPYNNPDIGSSALMRDSAAAYCHALQWHITGDKAHARKAIEILNAWSATLKSIEGSDQKLLAGITAYKFCNAAEIIRSTSDEWTAADVARFKNMLLNVFHPLIKDFKPEANGNWDASMILSMLCIGIFCDDRAMFDRAVDYFLNGKGKGAITHYVFATGQCQESTRDQQHTQLGLGMLAAACEVAWKQKVDLYGAADNRLALGFEYTAKYNLGLDVPCQGKISPDGRGKFRPIYEKVYQHYAIEKGLPMPYTKQVIEKIRPEGWSPDHESWGTLTCYKGPSASVSAAPAPKPAALPQKQ